VFTSLLKRSKDTFVEIEQAMGEKLRPVPVINSWRLNERHYGALVRSSISFSGSNYRVHHCTVGAAIDMYVLLCIISRMFAVCKRWAFQRTWREEFWGTRKLWRGGGRGTRLHPK
jgi:hypothetical protein